MRIASAAALRALSTPTAATGTPGGICAIASSASRPPATEVPLVSEGLELAEPATASLVIAKYHFSTFGPYNEAILGVGCKCRAANADRGEQPK